MNIKSLAVAVSALVLSTSVNAAPIALWNINPNPAAPGQFLNFDIGSSYDTDPSLSIVSYSIDFDDGTNYTGTDSSVSHAYSLFGVYNPTLTVGNTNGEIDASTLTVYVNQGNLAPIANSGNYTLYQGDDLVLDGSSSTDPNISQGDSIVNYEWDLDNDGDYDAIGIAPVISDTLLSTLGIDSLGTRNIHLRVSDIFGATSVTTAQLEVLDASLKPVPVPAAAWLFGSGLIGLVGVARRKSS
jgi:hypothetical protein